MLAGLPYGAVGQDTAEYMLGSVVASVVFFESDGSRDPNVEDWNPLVRDSAGNVVLDARGQTVSASGPNLIEDAKSRVIEGVQWWEDALVNFYTTNYEQLDPIHSLNFTFDFGYAHNPVATGYEPIARRSQDYPLWVADFLRQSGHLATGSIDVDIRSFNNAQRLKYDADWAFTIFVVNDYRDSDGLFAPGSDFMQAFSFAGGRFIVSPARRPASTLAHETGHIFYARDEYPGSGASYIDQRGYYNAPNSNAWDNPTPGFDQQISLMNSGYDLQMAYANHTSSDSSLAMVGWRDADGDGVFDVLDVPLTLSGSGYYDSLQGVYRFVGASSVQTLPNLNSWGLRNDITINEVSQLAYSLDAGATWSVFKTYNSPAASIDVRIPIQPGDEILIRTQAVDPLTHRIITTSAEVFHGNTELPTAVTGPGIEGFVWYDKNLNGQWDVNERGVSGWTMQLIDAGGAVLPTAQYVEPDAYQHQEVLNNVLDGVTLTAVGTDVKDGRVGALVSSVASTGDKLLGLVRKGNSDDWVKEWTSESRTLRIDLDTPTTFISIDALASGADAYARLEIYDEYGTLIDRQTISLNLGGAAKTLALGTSTPRISHAIVRATNSTRISLDRLQVGPSGRAVTDARGAYSFSYLPAGEYRVQGVPSANWQPADPVTGIVEVTVAADGDMFWEPGTDRPSDIGATLSATASLWRNHGLPYDVNDDGYVAPIDVLLVIKELNARGGRKLPVPEGPQPPPPYLDVNGDGSVSPIDALWVIDYLKPVGSRSRAAAVAVEGTGSTQSPGDGESEPFVWGGDVRWAQPVTESREYGVTAVPRTDSRADDELVGEHSAGSGHDDETLIATEIWRRRQRDKGDWRHEDLEGILDTMGLDVR